MATILAGRATAAQLIAFVVALRAKGETADELSGLLDAVLGAAELVPLGDDLRARAVDVVGTGGDRSHSINVSTMAAIVVAGAGVPVCKHGARGASSQAGTADVLEALGVAIELSPEGVRRCVDEAGIGFCFAPRFHPAFRFAAPARREIGIPTVFNLLGPMANPGRVRRQLIGVADARFAERMLASLRAHGSTDAWVVHGGGLDELTTTGPSTVLALQHDGSARTFTVDPVELGPRAGHPRAARRRRSGAQRRRRATGGRRRATVPIATSSCSTPPPRSSSPVAARPCGGRGAGRGGDRRRSGRRHARPVRRRVAGRRGDVIVARVPASSANLGPGFDALGMALSMYAEIGASNPRRRRQARPCRRAPPGERSRSGSAAARAPVWVRSPIPVGRGLGFSGAMRVGGLLAASAQRSDPAAQAIDRPSS